MILRSCPRSKFHARVTVGPCRLFTDGGAWRGSRKIPRGARCGHGASVSSTPSAALKQSAHRDKTMRCCETGAPPPLRPGAAAELCQKISGRFGQIQIEKKCSAARPLPRECGPIFRIPSRGGHPGAMPFWCGNDGFILLIMASPPPGHRTASAHL